MDALRIRRLCVVLALLAFALPLVPGAVGSPLMGGGRCGNAPLYGEQECLELSLGFLGLATLGMGLTQSALPSRLRRWTLPKAFAVGVLYAAALPVLTQR